MWGKGVLSENIEGYETLVSNYALIFILGNYLFLKGYTFTRKNKREKNCELVRTRKFPLIIYACLRAKARILYYDKSLSQVP